MNKSLLASGFLLIVALLIPLAQRLTPATAQDSPTRLLRHMVLFKFKPDATAAQIQEVTDAFAGLPKKIETIQAFEWGTDVSVEKKSEGFTHCFLVTFRTAQDRDGYIPHPAHQEFVKLVGPRLDKVLVVDYWANK